MIRPAEEEEPAVSSITTTGAISMTGGVMLPAKAVEAAPTNAAASTNFFMLFLQLMAHGKVGEVIAMDA
jgi:hypothetical protein